MNKNKYLIDDSTISCNVDQLSVEKAGSAIGTEWRTSTHHRTPPRRNGGETAEKQRSRSF